MNADCCAEGYVYKEAEHLDELLMKLIRRLFVIDPNSPTSDLSISQVRICNLLTSGPRSMVELCKELGMSASSVSQFADRLEFSGIVERRMPCTDRRLRELRLTDRGAAMMRERRRFRIAHLALMLDDVPSELRLKFLNTLEALAFVIERNGEDDQDGYQIAELATLSQG